MRKSAARKSGSGGRWKDYFSDEHKGAFKKYGAGLLVELGYEKDSNWRDSKLI